MSTDTDLLATLNRIADALELANLLTVEGRPAAPARTLYRALEAYPVFDWGAIHADVLESDEWGAVIVEWNSRQFKRRRSPADDSKGEAIWFSRPWSGTVEGKDLVYEKLIVFRDSKPGSAPKAIKGELADRLRHAAPALEAPAPSQPSAPLTPPPHTAPSHRPSQGLVSPGTPPPAPASGAGAQLAPRVEVPHAINNERDIMAHLKGGATLEDLARAVNGKNGATLFHSAARYHVIDKATMDAAKAAATASGATDWAKAIRGLAPGVEPF